MAGLPDVPRRADRDTDPSAARLRALIDLKTRAIPHSAAGDASLVRTQFFSWVRQWVATNVDEDERSSIGIGDATQLALHMALMQHLSVGRFASPVARILSDIAASRPISARVLEDAGTGIPDPELRVAILREVSKTFALGNDALRERIPLSVDVGPGAEAIRSPEAARAIRRVLNYVYAPDILTRELAETALTAPDTPWDQIDFAGDVPERAVRLAEWLGALPDAESIASLTQLDKLYDSIIREGTVKTRATLLPVGLHGIAAYPSGTGKLTKDSASDAALVLMGFSSRSTSRVLRLQLRNTRHAVAEDILAQLMQASEDLARDIPLGTFNQEILAIAHRPLAVLMGSITNASVQGPGPFRVALVDYTKQVKEVAELLHSLRASDLRNAVFDGAFRNVQPFVGTHDFIDSVRGAARKFDVVGTDLKVYPITNKGQLIRMTLEGRLQRMFGRPSISIHVVDPTAGAATLKWGADVDTVIVLMMDDSMRPQAVSITRRQPGDNKVFSDVVSVTTSPLSPGGVTVANVIASSLGGTRIDTAADAIKFTAMLEFEGRWSIEDSFIWALWIIDATSFGLRIVHIRRFVLDVLGLTIGDYVRHGPYAKWLADEMQT